jgi:predicted nucleic acid-binding protein
LCARVEAVSNDGGLFRVDWTVAAGATTIAEEYGISVYDAAYVAAAQATESQLVSCDVRDLVSRGLVCLPADTTSGREGTR